MCFCIARLCNAFLFEAFKWIACLNWNILSIVCYHLLVKTCNRINPTWIPTSKAFLCPELHNSLYAYQHLDCCFTHNNEKRSPRSRTYDQKPAPEGMRRRNPLPGANNSTPTSRWSYLCKLDCSQGRNILGIWWWSGLHFGVSSRRLLASLICCWVVLCACVFGAGFMKQ